MDGELFKEKNMPHIISNTSSPNSITIGEDYNYKYPSELDLKPGSTLHQELLTKIYNRARESNSDMSKRFDVWKKIDRNLTAYIPSDDAEKAIKEADDRKPVAIVVPYSYATLETLLTYMAAAFLDEPIFRYEGVGPEDTIGAMLLEQIINMQCIKAKAALNLHTSYRDGYSYGIGVVAPAWTMKMGKRVAVEENGFMSAVFGKWLSLGPKRINKDAILYEGNELRNIDPYLYLPDPNVPIHEPQRGEYVGWIEETNYIKLLDAERNEANKLFNVRYLKDLSAGSGRSHFNTAVTDSGRTERYSTSSYGSVETRPIDIIWLYVNLIPKEWKIGSGEYPEKWLFGLAADQCIVSASPMNLNHNMFPVSVCAPDSDGYSTSPVSRLEIVYGLQETLDWLFSSHVSNVRKAINDMLIVDPSLINVNDLKDPAPGKLIRMRRAAWGRGVENAVKQLQVTDITRQNIQDSGFITDLMQKCSGSVDALMGFQRRSSERVSATESRDTRSGALSRLAKTARLVSLQMMQDLGYILASQTQQLMTQEQYVAISGRWEEELRKEYGDVSRLKVTPFDLVIDMDVVPKDGSMVSGENADIWVQLFQTIGQQPLLMQQFDTTRIFMHIARMLGAKNVNEFRQNMQRVQPVTAPDATVEKEAQAGNLVPLNQIPASAALGQMGGV